MDLNNYMNYRMNERYGSLAHHRGRANMRSFEEFPEEFLPKPTIADYNRGRIFRFFLKRKNNPHAVICEVSLTQYSHFKKNPFYFGIKISWMISGPEEDIKINGYMQRPGVYDNNAREIMRGHELMDGLIQKLPNPLQFYGSDSSAYVID